MPDPQLRGATLAQRLAEGPLDHGHVLDILEQLLSQLAVAHKSGKIHGSISPRKIVIDADGDVTLVGFPDDDDTEETRLHKVKTAEDSAYMAPEQLLHDPVGPYTDYYSLGIVAYAMITGKDPFGAFDGAAAGDVSYRVLYKPTPHVPEDALVGLPASVGPTIDRAISREAHARFQDADSFLQSLKADPSVVAAMPAVLQKKVVKPAPATAAAGLGGSAGASMGGTARRSRPAWLVYLAENCGPD